MATFSVFTTESMLPKIYIFLRQIVSKSGPLTSIWLYHLFRIGLSTIFIWSGLAKLKNPQIFAILIDSYGLIPESWTSFVSYALPLLEVVAGIGLLIDLRGHLAAITLMLVAFLFILGYGIHMGLDVDCGCFGPNDPEAKAYHGLRSAFYRDILLMFVIVYLYIRRRGQNHLPMRLKHLFQLSRRRLQ